VKLMGAKKSFSGGSVGRGAARAEETNVFEEIAVLGVEFGGRDFCS